MITISRDEVREPLYCIVPSFNPWRWKSHVKNVERAVKHFHDSGAVVVLVEVAFGRREFSFQNCGLEGMPANCGVLGTDPRFRHRYIQLRTNDELWLKENAINQGVARALPHDWQQVAWLDGDIHFLRPNWVGQIIHQLQHYAFVQPFTHARDLAPNYEVMDENYPHADGLGFVHAWQEGKIQSTVTPELLADLATLGGDLAKLQQDFFKVVEDIEGYYGQGPGGRVFPGLAMAATRKAWDDVGGLLDFAIWGGGDWHMSHALIEKTEMMMRNDLHRNYKKMVMQWYQRCRTHVRRNVGTVSGTVVHHWHGKKVGRGYNTKHAILARFGFDPLRHLKRDSQGLWQLHDDRSTAYVQIRDMMRTVARERNEDANEI